MTEAYHTFIGLLLPAGILEYFELVDVKQSAEGLHLYLKEKNIASKEYENQPLASKGFLPQVSIQDFPIRGQKVALQLKRRRRQVKASGAIITRDWDLVQKGARRPLSSRFF